MNYLKTPLLFIPNPKIIYKNIKNWSKSAEININEVISVLKEYKLKLKGRPTIAQSGERNLSAVIHTDKGKIILKRYQDSLGDSTILLEHSTLDYLKKINFYAVRLLKTKSGNTLARIGNKRFALFKYIENSYVSYDNIANIWMENNYIENAGKILASLHKSLENFKPCGYNPDGFNCDNGKRWRDSLWYIDKLNYCIQNTKADKFEKDNSKKKLLLKRAKQLKKLVLELNHILNNTDLKRQVIHKDFGPNHILYRKNEPPVIIDFEIARFDWRLIDIIGGFDKFCQDWSRHYSLNKMNLFYSSYCSLNNLTETEHTHICHVWKLLLIWGCILFWYDYCATGKADRISWAYIKLRNLDWITKRQDYILNHLNYCK